ncbi:amino acid adenylation domain-containing protein [Polymorphospora rubra]|uniref:non-ribosomal peptide synthetase family protein n=1 Tax=Polymorphospora rubra TaxID=338584 RepID=UPI0033D15ADB
MARRGLATAVRPAGIPRRPADAPVPLSPMQEGLWFLDRIEPGNPAYVLSQAARLGGVLRHVDVQAAVDDVVARHEALRTYFTERDGRVEQVVLPAGDPRVRSVVHYEDVSDRPDLEAAIVAAANAETETGFDLGRAPLLRVRLSRLGADDHLLVVSLHHIVADDRSVSVVMSEILDGQHRHRTGEGAAEPPAVQFPDHVVWQHGRMAAGAAQKQREFWTRQLAGATGMLELPTDRPRPAKQTFAGRTRSFPVPDGLAAAVDALARRTGSTRFMVFLAATQILLSRLSGQDDVIVGSPVSIRRGPEQESIVGLMVNSLPLRTDLSGDPTLAEVLDRVRRTCVESLDHADLPFEQVVELAKLPRDLSRNPLFQVMALINPGGVPRPWKDLTLRPVGLARDTARMDLTVAAYEFAGRLGGVLDYNTDLFDAVTIDRLVARFLAVLSVLTGDPDRRLSTLDLTGPAELADLARWNDTGRDYQSGAGLYDLFAAQASLAPEAPALLDASPDAPPATAGTGARPDGSAPPATAPDIPVVTYGELDRRAGVLADRLRSAGVRPDQPVAVALPAGVAAVTGILGVLRAGAGYLPLDPAHPPARLRALLDDAGVAVTVTGAAHAAAFADWPGTLIVLDADGHPTGAGPAAGPVVPAAGHPDQLAYVIYTSGSTGAPKGVMVGHRTAANLALAFADLHDIGPGDRLLMLPPLSFDASVGDLFPALISGAAVVLHREPAALTGPGVLELCHRHGITLVDTAAPLWIRWVGDLATAGDTVDTGPLRAVMVGGEGVPLSAVRDWAARTNGKISLYNHYGPTEATVCATTYATVDGAELPGLTRLPIGRPVPNVRVHVLGRDLRPVPIGTPGEVYVGGTAPARGYLGAPGVTATRFVPDPFGAPGDRLYRTGDLARHRSDGTLEFLGRTDRQVKIRGHRIEIGEVEAACADLPGVSRAAVVVAEGNAGPRLVAYLVPGAGDVDVPAARAALRRRMPDHLVPSAFVVVADLPVNRHGKLDLAALPDPGAEADRPPYVPPRTDTERAVAAVWSDLLDGARAGRHDNFFDLGGHSLLAAPFVAALRARLGVDVSMRALFDTADLAGLAALVDGDDTDRAAAGVELLRAEARLGDALPVAAGEPAVVPAQVLFTGATGFLGAYLLADWLDHTTATVHCLVRAATPAAATDRVRANLRKYGKWRDGYAGRIVGVPGDLGEPRLGLTGAAFADLADRLDAVVHNGGVVNFLQAYPALRPANVGGTLEVLRLAGTGRPTAVHFVSTLGVFLTPANTLGLVHEGDRPDDCEGIGEGYNATKWVADALVRAARDRGMRVGVHRPARITGDAVSGVGNVDDYFSRLLKTCVQLRAVPDIDDAVDLAPVDYVGAGIGHLTRTGSTGDHHFYNNRTITFGGLAEALTGFGYPADLVPYGKWRAALLDRPDAALAGFAPMFGTQTPVRTQPTFDCSATEATLAAAGIVCPPADPALVHTYLSAFVRAGFLDPPSPGSSNG